MKLTGFQRTAFKCAKCEQQVSVETDYVSTDDAVKKLHRCSKGGKSETVSARKN